MNQLRFRIYYGYNQSDYIAIPESELERAEYAWKKNAIFSYGGKQVKGAEFKRIEEDYRHYTGWYDSYSPSSGEDFLQIEREMPKSSLFQDRLALAQERVRTAIQMNRVDLLGEPEKVDKLLLN